jgi:hypothetical protein
MVTDVLERRLRRLLLAYPAGYRRERGAEIVTTLLDTARPGQRVPGAADAVDVVRAGLRCRVAALGPGLAGGARTAAPFALALAAGISAYLWWHFEPTGPATFGPFRTVGPAAYAAWVLAALVRTRWSIGIAFGVTLATPLVAVLAAADRPPLWTLTLLAGLGLLALSGRASTVDIPLGALAVAVVAGTLSHVWPAVGYYQPREVGAVVALTALVVLAGWLRRGVPERLVAAALLAVAVGWLGPYVRIEGFGRLAEVLLATSLGVVALLRPRSSLAAVAGATLGSAAGIGGFLTIVGWSPYAAWTVILLALVGVLGCVAAGRLRPGWWLAGALAGLAAAWAVAVYDNDWSAAGWPDRARTATLVATMALVPMSACAAAAGRRLVRAGRAVGGRRPAQVAVVAISGAWLAAATLPYVAAWGPQLAVLLTCLIAAAGGRWRPAWGRMGR